ncbi:MAG: hypothetical protein R2698_00060 [Microthrixaceae bacterium]
MTGPVDAAEHAAEALRTVNHLTTTAPAPRTPGWEDLGDLYRVLGELRVLAERLPQACGQLARHLERPESGCAYEVDAMTDKPAPVVVASAVLALEDAQRCATRTGKNNK